MATIALQLQGLAEMKKQGDDRMDQETGPKIQPPKGGDKKSTEYSTDPP